MTQLLQVERNIESGLKQSVKTDASANADAVITLAAMADEIHVLDQLWFSYSGTPTGGRLIITIGGVTKLDLDVTQSGPGPLPLSRMNGGKVNEAVVITLKAAGAGVVGKLAAQYW